MERLAELRITQGYATQPARYCPDGPVTRGQMATFLVRTFDLDPSPTAGFHDTTGHTHATGIGALAAAGITAGCSTLPPRFCPDAPVTRGQMATFLARALKLVPLPDPDARIGPGPGPTTTTMPSRPGPYVAVSAGGQHACAIRSNATVTCWGRNDRGPLKAPEGFFNSLSADTFHTCGIRVDGRLTCWGSGQWQDVPRPPDGEFTAVSSGWGHACAIRADGSVVCWSRDKSGYTDIDDGGSSTVTVGEDHACGTRKDGTVTCWGNNRLGQLDAPEGTFTTVTAGGHLSCGLATDGTIDCWGGEGWGKPGFGASGGRFTSVATGSAFSCGLRSDGSVDCWGDDYVSLWYTPSDSLRVLDMDADRACGIRSDRMAVCWGLFESERYYGGSSLGKPLTAIATGADHACGLHSNGRVECWGDSRHGQTRAPSGSSWPSHPARATRAACVRAAPSSAGDRTGMARSRRRTASSWPSSPAITTRAASAPTAVACWGWNAHGQIDSPDGRFTAATGRGQRFLRPAHRRHGGMLGCKDARRASRRSRSSPQSGNGHPSGRPFHCGVCGCRPRVRDTGRWEHRLLGQQLQWPGHRPRRALHNREIRRQPNLRNPQPRNHQLLGQGRVLLG